MKHWEYKEQYCGRDAGYVLKGDGGDRVLVISEDKDDPGKVMFREACDNCFGISMSRSDAVAAIRELADKLEGRE